MWILFKQFLVEWGGNKNERAKLQQAYFLIIVLFAVAAGFLSLINYEISRLVMLIAALVALVYVINGIVWALLSAFVMPVLPKGSKPSRKK